MAQTTKAYDKAIAVDKVGLDFLALTSNTPKERLATLDPETAQTLNTTLSDP